MLKRDSAQEPVVKIGIRIKSIKRCGVEDVYCLVGIRNGTMIANGIITKNCDALRYACASHKVAPVYDANAANQQHNEWKKNRYRVTR